MRTVQQIEVELKAAKPARADAVTAKASLKSKAKVAEKKAADDLVNSTSDKVKELQSELKAAKAAEKSASAKPVVTQQEAAAETKAAESKATAEDPAALARKTIESDRRVAVTLTGGGKDSQTVMVIPGTPLQDVLKDIGWSMSQTFKKVGDNNQPGAALELATRITAPIKIVAQPRSTGGN